MKNEYKALLFLLLLSLPFNVSFSQDGITGYKGTVIVIPGKQYEAGVIHEFLFGSHWRDVWTTPIKVNVLDLNTYAGGLTPTKRGGGLQTKSLHFKGADGKKYKFMSVDKDPSKVLN